MDRTTLTQRDKGTKDQRVKGLEGQRPLRSLQSFDPLILCPFALKSILTKISMGFNH